MSRRNANTTINPSLRFLNVQWLHGETEAHVVMETIIKKILRYGSGTLSELSKINI